MLPMFRYEVNLKIRLAISPKIWYNKSNGYAAKCNAEFVKKSRERGDINESRSKFEFTFK